LHNISTVMKKQIPMQIPNSLKKLVRQFVIKFSGDYIFDFNEN
jgi:hypothetical protein